MGKMLSVECTSGEGVGINFKYPMYVISVKDALKCDSLESHQSLLAQGKLIKYTGQGDVIFVSHQWLGGAHPDKDMKQFKVFQKAMQNILAGKPVLMCNMTMQKSGQKKPCLDVETGKALIDAFIWYDWFGIPQIKARSTVEVIRADVQAAVDSIPDYVAACKYFFVLAPALYNDFGASLCAQAWSLRGWCRVELAARVFAQRPESNMILITSPEMIIEAFPFAWLHMSPRYGQFTVGADCADVCKLMRQLMLQGSTYEKSKGNIFEARFLQCMSRHAAPDTSVIAEDLTTFLETLSFQSAKEAGPFSWAPIHFAALEGNTQIITALLADGEEVDRPTTEDQPMYSAPIGMTPLMIVASYIPDEKLQVEVAKVLIAKGAKLTAQTKCLSTPLHQAAGGAAKQSELLDYFVTEGADVEAKDALNFTPVVRAAWFCPGGTTFAKAEKMKALISKHKADFKTKNVFGQSVLSLMASVGSPWDIEFLLNLDDSELTEPIEMRLACPQVLEAVMPAVQDPGNLANIWVPATVGGSLLHCAAVPGNAAATKLLLRRGVDPGIKNLLAGRTAEEIAREAGIDTVADILQAAQKNRKPIGCGPNGNPKVLWTYD